MRHRPLLTPLLCCVAAAALALAAACRDQPAIEPLQLDGNLLTVNNRSTSDWKDVEIKLNLNHTVRVPLVAAGARLQVPLDAFVAGFGQRFNYKRTQITDLRLTAKLPDGSPLALRKEFTQGGLAGVFGGKR